MRFTHYTDVIMSTMASQITSLTIVYTSVYSGVVQRKYQSSASLAFVRGMQRWPANSPHKRPVTRKIFPFDDVIMVPCAKPCKSSGRSIVNECLVTSAKTIIYYQMCLKQDTWHIIEGCFMCHVQNGRYVADDNFSSGFLYIWYLHFDLDFT